MKKPIVSIVMPTYNRKKYLKKAIESILNQSLKRLELIIVDDGSTDGTAELAKEYAKNDPRVVFIHNEKDKGVIGASNLGIRKSKGKYIARMDSDDISLPKRLEKEVYFLEKHPGFDACGGWVETLGIKGGVVWQLPTTPEEIKCTMLFCGAIANPTSMVRRSVFFDLGFWYESYKGIQIAEDYDFWTRIAEKVKIANLPSVVLLYRWHDTNATTSNVPLQTKRVKHIMFRQIKKLGLSPTKDEMSIHLRMGNSQFIGGKHAIEKIEKWTDKLIAANITSKAYPEPAFSKIVTKQKEKAVEIHKMYRQKFKIKLLLIFFVAGIGKILRMFLPSKIVDALYQRLIIIYNWLDSRIKLKKIRSNISKHKGK